MTKNEELYKILDRMFPGEFTYKASSSYLKPLLRHNTRIDSILVPEDLVDAFWLAEKLELFDFEDVSLFKHKNEATWSLVSAEGDHQGLTPQEAIVNAIIAIYGSDHE